MYRALRRRARRPDQPRHPPPARAAARRAPQDRADDRAAACRCPARRSSTTATRSGWATTSTSAIATACARRCSGARTRNGGFSRANPQKLYLPPIIDPEYHYEAINVEAQQSNPSSLLWWMKRLHRQAQGAPAVRARLDRVHRRRQPARARVRPRVRGRGGAGRRQPVALRAVRAAQARAVHGHGADRAVRAHPVPGDRRGAVLPVARAARLLLAVARAAAGAATAAAAGRRRSTAQASWTALLEPARRAELARAAARLRGRSAGGSAARRARASRRRSPT